MGQNRDHFNVPLPNGREEKFTVNTPQEIMGHVNDTIFSGFKDLKNLTDIIQLHIPEEKRKSIYWICEKCFSFLESNLKMNNYHQGKELIHSPARAWQDREFGIPFTSQIIFLASMLENYEIEYSIRMVRFKNHSQYSSCYLEVKDENGINIFMLPGFQFNALHRSYGSTHKEARTSYHYYHLNMTGEPALWFQNFTIDSWVQKLIKFYKNWNCRKELVHARVSWFREEISTDMPTGEENLGKWKNKKIKK